MIAIQAYRNGSLDVDTFPNCATLANDKRMVREFLLFLSHYGFCDRIQSGRKSIADEKYSLRKDFIYEIDEISRIPSLNIEVGNVVKELRRNPVIVDIERQKVMTRVLARPQQANFRKQVLSKFDYTCLLTGEKLGIVLEACHIIPVENKGNDVYENGFCFRSDIHILYDTKNIRIRPDGHIEYSEALQQSISYANLPTHIKIPDFISEEALNWRYDYY
ncbi:HNH endonuclease signature motif containing protein [Runella sp.]|uniref:HNH endonuclease signature motif containing protein n=1 Tax=Runella sp. TaxID=1960881 RepID=UPI0026046154|nr:HNH endonuclease signature motif containing protein [Runella sp.]